MTLVQWGNSSAIRISKEKLAELNWTERTQLRETIVDGKLIIEAVKTPTYTLDQLLKGMTSEDFEEEIDPGPSIGNEF
jgi:antitoxin component of MazEF toxin-antitoxin module